MWPASSRSRGLHGARVGGTRVRVGARTLTYEFGVTGVHTTAADAVAGGRGVCQDYADIMLALCRAAGLPARYVSGHLVGEGGSHAWVEVVVTDVVGGRDRPGRRGARSIRRTIGGPTAGTSPLPSAATTPMSRRPRDHSSARRRECSPRRSDCRWRPPGWCRPCPGSSAAAGCE